MDAIARAISQLVIPFAIALFIVGVVTLIVGAARRRVTTQRVGAQLIASAVIAIPVLAAIARLMGSPLPPDTSMPMSAFDTLVSIGVIALGILVLVYVGRFRLSRPSSE